MQRSTLSIFMMAVLSGCNPSEPEFDGECRTTTDCPEGNVCQDNSCITLCWTQSDCEDGLLCSPGGLCQPPEAGDTPVIERIAGNNSEDPQRVKNGIIVEGELLDEAVFELASEAESTALEVTFQSANQARLLLPPDVRSGAYALVATNQSGSTSADVQLTLPDLNGPQILQKLNADSMTGELRIERLPVGRGAGQIAPGDHGHDDYVTRLEQLESDRDQLQTRQQDLQRTITNGNLIPNSDFRRGQANWIVKRGDPVELVAPADGPGPYGEQALQSPQTGFGDATWVSSQSWVPVDPSARYELRAAARLVVPDDPDATVGNVGSVHFAVRFRDAAGEEIFAYPDTPDETWHFLASFEPPNEPSGSWRTYRKSFGARIPPDARSMTVAAVINVNLNDNGEPTFSTPVGNRTFQVQGMQIARLHDTRPCLGGAQHARWGGNGHCYALFDEAMTFPDAALACQAWGGHLATITSAQEQSFIDNAFGYADNNGPNAWFGYTDARSNDSGTADATGKLNWEWVSGEVAPVRNDEIYDNWSDTEPNNSGEEDCAHLTGDGDWNDQACVDKGDGAINYAFICERK